MKLARKVNLGGFQTMDFESGEKSTAQECARDLIAMMQPLAASSVPIAATVAEIKKAYSV